MMRPEPVIEFPRRVPIQHHETKRGPVTLDRDCGEPGNQPPPDPEPTRPLPDKDVFEIESRPPPPRREIGEEQRKTGWPVVDKGDDRLETAFGSEAVAEEVVFARRYRVRHSFVDREFANELQEQPHILCGSKADTDIVHRRSLLDCSATKNRIQLYQDGGLPSRAGRKMIGQKLV